MDACYPVDEGWPTKPQELLLRAALLPVSPAALRAWHFGRPGTGSGPFDEEAPCLRPLLHYNLRQAGAGIEAALTARLREAYIVTLCRNQALFSRAKALLQTLHGAGFQTMLLKGSALATGYYPDRGLRPMADVDLLVRTRQAEEVIAFLQRRGWEPRPRRWEGFNETYRGIAPSHEFMSGGQSVDLHWHVLPECCRPDSDNDFWDMAVPLDFEGVPTLALQPADQLLHVCVHGARRATSRPPPASG